MEVLGRGEEDFRKFLGVERALRTPNSMSDAMRGGTPKIFKSLLGAS